MLKLRPWDIYRTRYFLTALFAGAVNLQVINLRTLRPLDYGTVIKSVQKTNRLVTVEEGWPQNGIGADISAVVCEEAFDHLDAPIERVRRLSALVVVCLIDLGTRNAWAPPILVVWRFSLCYLSSVAS